MAGGGIPPRNAMSLCSANASSYTSPVKADMARALDGYGEE